MIPRLYKSAIHHTLLLVCCSQMCATVKKVPWLIREILLEHGVENIRWSIRETITANNKRGGVVVTVLEFRSEGRCFEACVCYYDQ